VAPKERSSRVKTVTLNDYSAAWLADRTLKPRTREHYRLLLEKQICRQLAVGH